MVDPGSRIANTMAARHDELPTIVAVDDTPEILDLLTMVLTEEGFQVVCCSDADRALEIVVAERPALVIVDLTMAGVSTWGLIDALIADPRTRHIPFIICSGAVQELRKAETRVQSLGGDVLDKPFDIDLLVRKIQHLIAGVGPT